MSANSGSVQAYQHMRHIEAARAREERQSQEQAERVSFYARALGRVGGSLVALGRSLRKRYGHLACVPPSQG